MVLQIDTERDVPCTARRRTGPLDNRLVRGVVHGLQPAAAHGDRPRVRHPPLQYLRMQRGVGASEKSRKGRGEPHGERRTHEERRV